MAQRETLLETGAPYQLPRLSTASVPVLRARVTAAVNPSKAKGSKSIA